MSDVSTIFFDFGGVLLTHMDGIDHGAVEAQFDLPERTLLRCLYGRESRYIDLQVGACTYEEWIESIRAAAANHMPVDVVDAFMDAWQNGERLLNEDMIALVGRLRDNGYTTGIISNTIPGMEERIQNEMPHLIPMFDIRVGSGDVKMAKPDPGIFHHALELAGVEPEAAVFTDDRSEYAQAARDLGMHGFHFTGYEQFAADLHSIGVRH